MRDPVASTPFRILALWLALTLPALASPVLGFQDGPGDPAATAPETTSQDGPSAAPLAPNVLKYSRFHKVLGRNLTSNLFSKSNLLPFLIGSGAALGIAPADQEISDALRSDPAPTVKQGTFANTGQIVGGIVTASFVGGSFVAGMFTKSEHFREFSYTLAQAYSTNVILTQGLKYTTHRMRPDGSTSNSFPSGHSSDTFAVSTVIWKYYGWKWGVPLYAVSGLVGLSRIEKGRHWPSDVVAGAALGYISANTAIFGTKRELAGKKITGLMVAPIYGRDRRGIAVQITY